MAKRPPHRKIVTDNDGSRRVVDRNANGEGSVYWDASKDRWRATYVDPTTGKRRTALGTSRADAEQRRDAKLAALASNSVAGILGPNPNVAQLCAWFLSHVADVRPTTLETYRKQCRVIDAHLGTVPVRDIGVEHVRLFMSTLRGIYDSDNTISNHRARLRQVIEEAVTLGYLPNNPVVKVDAPRRTRERTARVVLTAEQCQRLVKVCADHHLGAAVAMLFTVGNRASEVLGLAWSDLDLWDEPVDGEDRVIPRGTAQVRRGSTYLSQGQGRQGRMVLGETKTVSTQGTVILPPSVVTMFRARHLDQERQRAEAGMAWATTVYEGEPLDMVFTDWRGRPLPYHRLRDAVRDCCTAAGIDPVGVATHAGRRSVITALYGAGLDLSDIARFVGHNQQSTTAGYVHHLGERPRVTADFAAQLLDPEAGQRADSP